MPTRRWSVACAALIVGSPLFAVGCAADDPEPSESLSASPSEPRIFDGTIEEYVTLERACLEEKGIKTMDLSPDDPEWGQGYGVVPEGTTFEEREVSYDECEAEIGTPRMQNLSDTQLRERYDSRVEQWTCLVSKELVTGDPLSYETFVDKYERSGQKTLWEPTETAADVTKDGRDVAATDECPRGTW